MAFAEQLAKIAVAQTWTRDIDEQSLKMWIDVNSEFHNLGCSHVRDLVHSGCHACEIHK